MRKILAMLAICLSSHQVIAQGTAYISNLNRPTVGSYAVASDSQIGLLFGTGFTSPGDQGYMLNSIQLSMANATGNPSGFKVAIYDASARYQPQNSLAVLAGSANPSTAGLYIYVPTSGFVMLPGYGYLIVLTADNATTDGAYQWNYTGSSSRPYYDLVYNWQCGIGAAAGWHSSDGFFWIGKLSGNPELAIMATPVPEPSLLWLLLLGGGVLALSNGRKAKHP